MSSKGTDILAHIGKQMLLTFQGHKCLICAEPLVFSKGSQRYHTSVEHVHPRCLSESGQSQVGNIALTHTGCNHDKGNLPPTRCEVLWLWVLNRKMGYPEELTAKWDQREGDCQHVLQQAVMAKYIVNR